MAALLLFLVVSLVACGDSPTQPNEGTALDGRVFYSVENKMTRVDGVYEDYSTLTWWHFTGDQVEFSDGGYSYCTVVLEASNPRLIPPDGQYLFHSFGRYIYEDGTLDLFREGGQHYTLEGQQDLPVDIFDGVNIVDFGTNITVGGTMYQQTTTQDIGAMRAGTKRP